MAKIDRHELTRGTLLSVGHVDPLLNAQAALSTAAIAQKQLAKGYSTFRVDIWTPYIGSSFLGPGFGLGDKPFSIPFILPPTQDFFDITAPGVTTPGRYNLTINTPIPVLTEIIFSFDQRAEGAAITDQHHNPGVADWNTAIPSWSQTEAGFLDFTNAKDVMTLGLSIVEKTQEHFQQDGGSAQTVPEKEVLAYELPADAFIGKSFRANPFVVKGLNHPLHPYKTYVALIHCSDLWALGERPTPIDDNSAHVLLSVNISLKFRIPLMPRDLDVLPAQVQNIPVIHGGVINAKIETVAAPVAGANIEADAAAGGISPLIDVIDRRIRQRLHGGYSEAGEAKKTEIQDDAGYEVISIPLFANSGEGGVSALYGKPGWPFYKAATDMDVWDRGIVPLKYPFVLHHAIFCWNWQTWSRGYSAPATPNTPYNLMPSTGTEFTLQVGVNLGAGLKGDLLGYQPIATLEKRDPLKGGTTNWLWDIIDRVRVHEEGDSIQDGGYIKRQWDLFPLELVRDTVIGVGYPQLEFGRQGSPIWCGKSDQTTAWNSHNVTASGRSALGGGAPPLNGMEQFIEVKARLFYDIPNPPEGVSEMIVGYGGHRVYLIGKKHLAGARNPR